MGVGNHHGTTTRAHSQTAFTCRSSTMSIMGEDDSNDMMLQLVSLSWLQVILYSRREFLSYGRNFVILSPNFVSPFLHEYDVNGG